MAAAAMPLRESISPSFTISSHPLIQTSLTSLKSAKGHKEALHAIRALSATLLSIDGLSGMSLSRVQFIGNFTNTRLEENKAKSNEYKLFDIAIEILNLLNALQVETFMIGTIGPFIDSYTKFLSPEVDDSTWEQLSPIFSQVRVDFARGLFVIDERVIYSYFASVDLSRSDELVDKLILSFLSNSECEGDKLLIPFDKKIVLSDLELLLKSPAIKENPAALRIVLLLCVCYYENSSVPGCKEICHLTLSSFATPTCDGRYILDQYLEKEGLVPLLSRLIRLRKGCLETRKDFMKTFFSQPVIREFFTMFGRDWLEEAGEAYMLAYQIQLYTKKHFIGKKEGNLICTTSMRAADPIILFGMSEVLRDRPAGKTKYPISEDAPFCTTLEEFMLLPFYRMLGLWEKEHETEASKPASSSKKIKDHKTATFEEASVVVVSSKRRKPDRRAPKEKPAVISAAALASSVWEDCPADEVELEAKAPRAVDFALSSAAGGAGAGAGAGAAREMAHIAGERSSFIFTKHTARELDESLAKSKKFLEDLHFHPRVISWFRSPAEGLTYYGFDDPRKPQSLTREEMTLRHRFPPQLLLLAFNPLFAKPCSTQSSEGSHNQLWKSIVIINGKKHLMEACVDGEGCVYHFYAKPISQFADYVSSKVDPSSATVGGGAGTYTMSVTTSEGDISYDSKGNAIIEFDGRSITVVAL